MENREYRLRETPNEKLSDGSPTKT
jgi:hypothetical protein